MTTEGVRQARRVGPDVPWRRTPRKVRALLFLVRDLQRHAGGEPCFAGQKWLARRIRTSTRSIQRHVHALAERGLLTVRHYGRHANEMELTPAGHAFLASAKAKGDRRVAPESGGLCGGLCGGSCGGRRDPDPTSSGMSPSGWEGAAQSAAGQKSQEAAEMGPKNPDTQPNDGAQNGPGDRARRRAEKATTQLVTRLAGPLQNADDVEACWRLAVATHWPQAHNRYLTRREKAAAKELIPAYGADLSGLIEFAVLQWSWLCRQRSLRGIMPAGPSFTKFAFLASDIDGMRTAVDTLGAEAMPLPTEPVHYGRPSAQERQDKMVENIRAACAALKGESHD